MVVQLCSTGDCIKAGKHLSLKRAKHLKRLRNSYEASADRLCDSGKLDSGMVMATKAQFCKEIILFSPHACLFKLKPFNR